MNKYGYLEGYKKTASFSLGETLTTSGHSSIIPFEINAMEKLKEHIKKNAERINKK